MGGWASCRRRVGGGLGRFWLRAKDRPAGPTIARRRRGRSVVAVLLRLVDDVLLVLLALVFVFSVGKAWLPRL